MEILLVLHIDRFPRKETIQVSSKGLLHFLSMGWDGVGDLPGCLQHSGLEDELIVKAKELILREQKLKIKKALF